MVASSVLDHGDQTGRLSRARHGPTQQQQAPAAGHSGLHEPVCGLTICGMTAPTPANPSAKKRLVLLVDDEKPLIEMFAEILSPWYVADLATSTKEAGELMRHKSYDVVVSDYDMPGGDGLSFLIKIRRDHPETKRILLSSYMKPEFMGKLNEAKLDHYLLKPISAPVLLKAIHAAARQQEPGITEA
jgi:CheY-like chemotaxis protein